jgi:5'-3' exonuclease
MNWLASLWRAVKKSKPKTKRIALVDGDTLIYSAALAAEKAVEWENDLWTLHADFGDARKRFDELVAGIQEALKADHIIMALTDGSEEVRWRNKVMETYKMNRKKTRRPVVWRALREYVHESFETFERPGLEGDDVLGILCTRKGEAGEERIIVSIDKDLKTIPGKLYNYGKPEVGIVEIGEDEANAWHMMQTLTGDTTDGYPGCPGVGAVTAKKLLDPCWMEVSGEMLFDDAKAWSIVLKAYQKAGLGEEVALENARVARILRVEDYDFKNQKVKLWQPGS